MSGAFFAFVAVILCGIGARDQLLIADLIRRSRGTAVILALGLSCAIASSILAAVAATTLIPHMTTGARHMMAIIATAWAGAEALVLSPRKSPAEPTHSLGALAIVLFTSQITDVARMLIFAIAIASGAALPAGAGGAFGAGVSIALVAITPDVFSPRSISGLRRAVGLFLLVLAASLAWQAYVAR